MNGSKKLGAGFFVKIAVCIVFAAYVALVLCGQFIFKDKASIMHNLFAEANDLNVYARIARTGFVIALCYVIMQLSNIFVWLSTKIKNNGVKTTLLLLGNIVKYAAAIAIVLVSLGIWGVDTTAIVTGAGVLTLVIGLGCQSLISDIVAGIFMLFEGDIKVGDIVVIDGWRGTVQQIGLRRTRIEDAVGNINIVNNASISNIINNTQDLSVALVDVGTEYNESILRIEEVIQAALPEMKKHVPAIVEGPFYKGVSALGESSVNIRLIAKCKEEDKYQVERDLNRELKILFDANDINIPFNQIVLNTRDPHEPNKTQYKPKNKATENFAAEQAELSRGIEEQSK